MKLKLVLIKRKSAWLTTSKTTLQGFNLKKRKYCKPKGPTLRELLNPHDLYNRDLWDYDGKSPYYSSKRLNDLILKNRVLGAPSSRYYYDRLHGLDSSFRQELSDLKDTMKSQDK